MKLKMILIIMEMFTQSHHHKIMMMRNI
jgi:hypothetical protein